MRPPLFALLMLLSLAWHFTNAAECTDSEATYANSVWAAAAATSACAPYVTQTEPVYVNAPCTATDCVTVVEGVAENLPDCTYSGINNKIEVQNALTSCNGGDTEDAGSPTVVTNAPATSTTTTPTPTSSSTTECSTDEYQSTEDLYDTAAATSACSPYSTSSSSLVTVNVPCSVTDCIDTMTQLAADLPDCQYDGANQKAELQGNLQACTDDTTTEVDSTTPVSTSSGSTSSTPASTASSTGCTTAEAKEMWNLYTSTATSTECATDSTVNGDSVYIFTSCDSDCATKVKDLAESLPNCYYDYEFMNKKQDVLEELEGCEESLSYYISVTVYSDSSIEFASSSASSGASGSEPLMSGGSGSEPLVSGDPDKTLDSSTVGIAESPAPPRAFNGILQLLAIFTLLAMTILAL
ncbi:hypothetical protein PRNP1_009804 [Phytophthora ramorum]